jgi:hypothetical protein
MVNPKTGQGSKADLDTLNKGYHKEVLFHPYLQMSTSTS